MQHKQNIVKSDLFSDLTAAQQKDLREHLDAYLAVVLRIHRRLLSDPDATAELRAALGRNKPASGR